jgi:hypothetical protein
MAPLTASAMAMVNGSAEQVREALADYQTVRPKLLTENFDDYQVRVGGHGAGTEVRWTVLVGEVRSWYGRRVRRGKRVPWECVMAVEEPEEGQLVERDTRSALVATWTVRPAGDGRAAVRVLVSWEGPDGPRGLLRRPRQRLAVRTIYEDVLTRLHEHFEPDPRATPPATEPDDPPPGRSTRLPDDRPPDDPPPDAPA